MDVIVIGCGAAGLAAMRELHLKGLKVLGLEAADRIGGRILTVPYGEANIDLGAAWCHGDKKDNKVYELANPLNLLDRPEPDNKWYLQSNGELVSPDTAESILKVLDDAVAKANKYTTQSISECVRNTVHSNEILKKDNALSQTFVEWYERFHEVGGQDDPKARKSLRWLIEFWNKDGVMLNWKGKGYKTIIDILLNKYPDPSKEIPLNILLNKEVENISWGGSEDQLVQITCKDGSVYTAKSVIVTIPVAVLKEKHNQLFNPPLPVDKVKTITNFNVCVLDKIYIEFEKPWWPATPLDFTFLWREEDKAKFTGADKWITEIYGMISVIAQPNLLLAWINGTGAEMMEKRSEEEVQNGIQKLIDTILKKQFNVSPIKKILRTQWGSNPYARGAYVYRTVNSEENGGSAITLSEPLYNSNIFPTVCFAGEATSHHNHSDAHGAIESGIREAERLIESFQRL